MAYENIIVETRGKVGLITLNRPKALNALNDALVDELGDALGRFEADEAIGAMVITGSEKAFAAGADIVAMSTMDYMDVYKSDFITRNWERVKTCRKPVIAAVAGFALGGGCELAMSCDIIIAADTARFGQPEIKLGILPGAGGTQRLPRAVGKAKAMDLCLTARMMDAAEAERAGLVSRVVPADKLLEEALAAAETIAGFSLPVIMMVKECVNRAYESGRWPKACCSSGAPSTPPSRSPTSRKAWPPSSTSASRTSRTDSPLLPNGDRHACRGDRHAADPRQSHSLAEHQPGQQRRGRRGQIEQSRNAGGRAMPDDQVQQGDRSQRQHHDQPAQGEHELPAPDDAHRLEGQGKGQQRQCCGDELDHRAAPQVQLGAEALLVEGAQGDAAQRHGREGQPGLADAGQAQFLPYHQRHAAEAQHQTRPLPAAHPLAHHGVAQESGQQRLDADDQRHHPGRHAAVDGQEHAGKIAAVQ
jgi:enoyl-CoA hydratase